MKKIIICFFIISSMLLCCSDYVEIGNKNFHKYAFLTEDETVYTISYKYDGSYVNHYYLHRAKDNKTSIILTHEPLNVILGYIYSRKAKIVKLYPGV